MHAPSITGRDRPDHLFVAWRVGPGATRLAEDGHFAFVLREVKTSVAGWAWSGWQRTTRDALAGVSARAVLEGRAR